MSVFLLSDEGVRLVEAQQPNPFGAATRVNAVSVREEGIVEVEEKRKKISGRTRWSVSRGQQFLMRY